MKDILERIEQEGEASEEGDEGQDACIEQSFFGEDISQFGIDKHESDGHG